MLEFSCKLIPKEGTSPRGPAQAPECSVSLPTAPLVPSGTKTFLITEELKNLPMISDREVNYLPSLQELSSLGSPCDKGYFPPCISETAVGKSCL